MRGKVYSKYSDEAYIMACKVNTYKSQVVLTKHGVQSNMECVELERVKLADFVQKFESVIGDILANRDVFSKAYRKYYGEAFDFTAYAQWIRHQVSNLIEYDKGCRLPKDVGSTAYLTTKPAVNALDLILAK